MIRFLIALFVFLALSSRACSILYYVDSLSGKIYAVNNEDYMYDVKAYIKVIPGDKKQLGRVWYGWRNFAQGGVNESGLFFDAAVTPDKTRVPGYSTVGYNLGDRILATCKTVDEALGFLEHEKIAYPGSHLLFGDKTGNAAVIEWVEGTVKIIPISGHKMMVTNFLLSDTSKGNYPCPRFAAMEKELNRLEQDTVRPALREIGNVIARAVQPAALNNKGKEGGTLYSTFIDITDMKFALIYKYDNSNITKLDLKKEFVSGKKRKIRLK